MFIFSSGILKAFHAFLLLIFLAYGIAAQAEVDKCHVYFVDLAKSRHALRRAAQAEGDTPLAALSAAQTIFPEFHPPIGEEELTTKHYPFPGSKLIITASVFYTDESMASHGETASASRNDSMLVGITVSNRGKASAIEAQAGNSITEVTYDQYTNKVRAKEKEKIWQSLELVRLSLPITPRWKSQWRQTHHSLLAATGSNLWLQTIVEMLQTPRSSK